MRYFRFLFLILFNLLFITVYYSSHVPGGNISYECLGNNQYVITLTLFEDCGTAFLSNGPEPISITNNCGINFPTTYQLPIITFREEVSQLCAPLLAQSECNGGSLPGIYKHV
ncbi:MAG: hypothetical protein VX710_05210, partial [Bacteroidota bacterium]|nr:hypothetical protein [Bacteroidota bacterium]